MCLCTTYIFALLLYSIVLVDWLSAWVRWAWHTCKAVKCTLRKMLACFASSPGLSLSLIALILSLLITALLMASFAPRLILSLPIASEAHPYPLSLNPPVPSPNLFLPLSPSTNSPKKTYALSIQTGFRWSCTGGYIGRQTGSDTKGQETRMICDTHKCVSSNCNTGIIILPVGQWRACWPK